MFIKDGVYREIDVKVDAPIAEGTILTFGGALAAEDASDAFGIVPENIYVLPPTKKIRVVIGGTIDLDDPANKGVEFSEAVVNALGADINFVPAAEAGGGGGSELPAATSADAGKVLTVNSQGSAVWEEPAEPVDYEPVVPLVERDIELHGWSESLSVDTPFVEGKKYRVILDGVTYEPLTATSGEVGSVCLGNVFIADGDPQGDYSFCVAYFSGDDETRVWTEDSTAEHVTVRIDEYIEQTTVPKPTAEDLGKTLVVQRTGYTKGTVIIPEQTLTTTGDGHNATISNYDPDLWVINQKVVVCINDMEYESVLNDANGIADFYSLDDNDYAIILNSGVLGFEAPTNDDYVVSAYICEDVYGYVPAGGGGGGSAWDLIVKMNTTSPASSTNYSVLSGGTAAELYEKATVNGEPLFVLIVGYGTSGLYTNTILYPCETSTTSVADTIYFLGATYSGWPSTVSLVYNNNGVFVD